MKRTLYFLRELHARDIDWFIANGIRRNFTRGDVLIHESEYVEAIYLLTKGRFEVVVKEAPEPVAFLDPGEIVGELSFLDSRPPNATVRAATAEAAALSLPRWRIEEKLRNDAKFAARFYRAVGVLLASRLRKTTSTLGYPHNDTKDILIGDQKAIDSVSLAEGWLDYLLRKLNEMPSEDLEATGP